MNIFDKKSICFYLKNGEKISKIDIKKINELEIFKKLHLLNKKLKIERLLVKYDVIISEKGYAVLDIGLDPPQRMLSYFKKIKKNFYKFYLKFFIN